LAFSASSCARLSLALMPPTVEVTPCTYLHTQHPCAGEQA
jgi:hypothetical protein